MSTLLVVEPFDSSMYPDIGYLDTYPLYLNLDHHWITDSFEVGPTADECNIMMPWWWILSTHWLGQVVTKHGSATLIANGIAQQESQRKSISNTMTVMLLTMNRANMQHAWDMWIRKPYPNGSCSGNYITGWEQYRSCWVSIPKPRN
jgi:hypothetical protein